MELSKKNEELSDDWRKDNRKDSLITPGEKDRSVSHVTTQSECVRLVEHLRESRQIHFSGVFAFVLIKILFYSFQLFPLSSRACLIDQSISINQIKGFYLLLIFDLLALTLFILNSIQKKKEIPYQI